MQALSVVSQFILVIRNPCVTGASRIVIPVSSILNSCVYGIGSCPHAGDRGGLEDI